MIPWMNSMKVKIKGTSKKELEKMQSSLELSIKSY